MKDENKDIRRKVKKLFTRRKANKIVLIQSTDIKTPALIIQSDKLFRHEEFKQIATEIENVTACHVVILPPALRINAIIAGEQQKGGKA